MNRFDAGATCRKCGNTDILAHFCSTDRRCYVSDCPNRTRMAGYGERIHRYCRRCGHSWDEVPLDHPPKPIEDDAIVGTA